MYDLLISHICIPYFKMKMVFFSLSNNLRMEPVKLAMIARMP